jgi:hypothetical protein
VAGRNALAVADYSLAIAYGADPTLFYADRASVLLQEGAYHEAAQDYARLTKELAESPAPLVQTLEVFLSRDSMMDDSGPRTRTELLAFFDSLDAEIRESPLVEQAIGILRRSTKSD